MWLTTAVFPPLWQTRQFEPPCASVVSLPWSYVSIVLLASALVPTGQPLAGELAQLALLAPEPVGAPPNTVQVAPVRM